MRYFDTLATYERNGFTVIVDKAFEDDIHPRETFEECDVAEICAKIDNGTYDWFMLRIRVLVDDLELAEEYLGGCCYEDASEVLTDGTAEDKIEEALTEAKDRVYQLSRTFADLSNKVDAERCGA